MDPVVTLLVDHSKAADPTLLFTKSPLTFPVEDKSTRGSLALCVYHEAYAIGQMGHLRKMLGYESLAG